MREFVCKECFKSFFSNKLCKNRIPKFCSHRCSAVFNGKYPTNKQLEALTAGRLIPHSNKGSKWTVESKMRASLIRLGKKLPEYHRIALSIAKKGKPIQHFILHKEEIRQKISKSLMGKPQPWNKGENHPNWRGGITPVNSKIRSSLRMQEWRKKIFERDNYTCQVCGIRGGRLIADHIKPFSTHPKLRFELSNGRTICKKCDIKSDTYGGRALKYANA